jgi:hypothetical protein
VPIRLSVAPQAIRCELPPVNECIPSYRMPPGTCRL